MALFFAELCGLILLTGLVGRALTRVRGTTLVYAAWWSIAAVAALFGSLFVPPTSATAYVCWSLSVCPWLAILGAKRPQHHGWNLVVAALVGLLIYPVVQSEILRPGDPFDLGYVWPWFLLAAVLIAPALFFATRFSWPAILVGSSQALFFLPYLPFGNTLARMVGGPLLPWGIGLLVLAAVLAEIQFRRHLREDLHPVDAIWLDFRDSFGIFWGLRFAERVNEAAERFSWPVRLEWEGFVLISDDQGKSLDEALNETLARELRPTLRGLLRRFVDQAWIERHQFEAGTANSAETLTS